MGLLFFLGSVVLLILGYVVYGKFVERVFEPNPNRPTPAIAMADGVDYVELPPWRIFLIQLLNIAGLGPVFGAISGALYGPTALLWVVFGCILAGATHDYFSGMLSLRYGGASFPEMIGRNLGGGVRMFSRGFSVLVLLLVGIVFVAGPADLLAKIMPDSLAMMDKKVWVVIIFAYYFLATVLPIDVLIGRIYPFFAAILVFMAVSLTLAIIFQGYTILPNLDFATNTHPNQSLTIWPMLFITIACGAISGFHATQSPMMARCMANEKWGRPMFYGAMIAEGIIALIWVTLPLSFYPDVAAFAKAGPPPAVVQQISVTLLGAFGGALAILGVVVLPITSGDTAFRSARLTLAEIFNFSQIENPKRLAIAVPLFAVGIAVSLVDFGILWRYFGWANQTLATIMLWAGAMYLLKRNKFHWICTLPALFMTAMTTTYLMVEKNIGFGLPLTTSTIIGVAAALICAALFFVKGPKITMSEEEQGT